MDKLIDFVKVKNVIPKDVCNMIIKNLENDSQWKSYSYLEGNTMATDFESLDAIEDINLKLMIYVKEAVEDYNKYINQHNSFVGYNSQTRVKNYTDIRLHRCKINGLIPAHDDQEDGSLKTLFSIVGLLNDDFIGGEFVLFKDTDMKLKQGDILIFPSACLYPHRVDQVKSGVRYSFASWAW